MVTMTSDFNTAPRANPLAGRFRKPGIHTSLPTNGSFMPDGGIVFEANGQIAILPYVPADEILLKNPDSLMSGAAIRNLIQSCAPAIRDVDEISIPDLDVIMLSIRYATSGDTMDMEVRCEVCETDAVFVVDLKALLATVSPIPSEISVDVGDSTIIHLRPFTLLTSTKVDQATFDQYRRIQAVDGEEYTDADRLAAQSAAYTAMGAIRMQSLSECVIGVELTDSNTMVAEREFILEYLQKAGAKVSSKIEAKLAEINGLGMDKTMDITCINPKCNHEWKSKIEFNPSTFFA